MASVKNPAAVRSVGNSLVNESGTGVYNLKNTKPISSLSNNKEVNYLNVFYYIQNLLEEYTQNYIKQVKNSSVDLLPKSGIGPAGADSSSSAAENKKIIKLELEYENLVNEIIFDLYDEFKYGEALGLINKVVYKNVKKLVSENKKWVNRNRGKNYFIIPFIWDYSDDPNWKIDYFKYAQYREKSDINKYLFYYRLLQ